jgi:DNA-binding CsgD family transcriptional regulator
MKFVTADTATAESIEAALDDAFSAIGACAPVPEYTHMKASAKATSKYEEDLMMLAESGATGKEAGEVLGVSQQQVSQLCRTLGIKLRDGRGKK